MNTNTQIDKIDKVLSKISGKEMKGFVRLYAATHEDFATALVEKYWKPERGNYKGTGGGLLCSCWCVGQAIRTTPTGLEEDRERPGGNAEESQEHEEERKSD